MLRFKIKKLIKMVEEKVGERVTLKELHKASGVDRNALSRLVANPQIIPSAQVYDKLLNYAFEFFRADYNHLTDEEFIEVLFQEFVLFVPDKIQNSSRKLTPEDFEYYTR